jgi:ligand-binding sensor domain-containing protein
MLVRTIVLSRMLIDRNGTKWMATNRDGVVGFNESNNTFKKMTIGTDTEIYRLQMLELAIDNRNQLWIGTIKACVLPIGNFRQGSANG